MKAEGGNAAAFLNFAKDCLNGDSPKETLVQISKNIGADVPFFLSGFNSANVSEIGEIVSVFDDDIPKIDLIKSKIFCYTKDVFSRCKKYFSKFDTDLALNLEKLSSKEILNSYKNYELSDLL